MTFKEDMKEKLKETLKEKVEFLPAGYQAIGEIAIINLHKELLEFDAEIGKAMLEVLPRFKTVCNKVGEITGTFREPQIKVIAGEEKTEAIVKESGCFYKFDVRKLMFAKGNINERVRIAKQVSEGEVVVDMFAGLGYFSIPMGKLSKAKKIYSMELNPNAFFYLNENIKLNHIKNIETISGDCREVVDKLIERGVKADRVVMGYLPPPFEFIEWALKIVKTGGVIHYEDLLNLDKSEEEAREVVKKIQAIADKQEKKIRLISVNYVKDYRPHVGHYVLDLSVE